MTPFDGPPATVVDLFCGSGAVTEGLKAGGFQVVAAVDCDPVACATYRLNHGEVQLYEQDIKDIEPTKLGESYLRGRRLDLLVVCAPCQPFSSQNRSKKPDLRAPLLLHSIRFAQALKPKLIFFENVPGIASDRNAGLVAQLRSGLAAIGYHLSEPAKVEASEFGVPQRRLRCIMLASQTPVTPSDILKQCSERSKRTVRDVIGHLPSLRSGERDPADSLHAARRHQPIALKRLSFIPKNGGNRFALPADLELECHRGHSGHPDVYGRMSWDAVAPTLTTGCTDVTRGRFAHPQDDRAITLREAALLQTFPKSYRFTGNASEISTQIGNAVPVGLISALAPALRRVIAASDTGRDGARSPEEPERPGVPTARIAAPGASLGAVVGLQHWNS